MQGPGACVLLGPGQTALKWHTKLAGDDVNVDGSCDQGINEIGTIYTPSTFHLCNTPYYNFIRRFCSFELIIVSHFFVSNEIYLIMLHIILHRLLFIHVH